MFACQTQKELEIARDWNGGGRKSIHADLARANDEYEQRPKGPDGGILGTVAVAPTLSKNGHTKTSLMRLDPAQMELSSSLHEGGKVRKLANTRGKRSTRFPVTDCVFLPARLKKSSR